MANDQVNLNVRLRDLGPNTPVLIAIANTGGGGKTVNVNETVTFADLGINGGNGPAVPEPQFPQGRINEINQSAMTADEKYAQVQATMADYKAAKAEFEKVGGVSAADSIHTAVLNYVNSRPDFKKSGAQLTAKDLIVSSTMIPGTGQILFNVTGSPNWGI